MALWLAVLGDTLVVRQVPVSPSMFQEVAAVASGIVSIVLCLAILSLIPIALYVRGQAQRAAHAVTKAQLDSRPFLTEATALLADLRSLTTAAKADYATIHQVVVDTDAGIRAVRERVDNRLSEIDSLIGAVEQEFQDAFVSTAATLRGVRAGAAAFVQRHNGAGPATPAAKTAREATDLSVGVPHNGDDYTRHVRAGGARPRIRSRRTEG
jgi:hypothetical protein